MRLWSLHPQYLDAKGLVALWRESLLARAVLQQQTRGYLRHPQLDRFRAQADAVGALNLYLRPVWEEATRRGYAFNAAKLGETTFNGQLSVTAGQLLFELEHLRRKLARRSPQRLLALAGLEIPRAHPLFFVIPGEIEPWERGER